jgi:hypothetical protein
MKSASGMENEVSRPTKKRRSRWEVAALMLVFAVFFVYLYFGDTGIRQARRLRAVREHLPAMNRYLAANPIYSRVTANLYTGRGGSMMLVGTVATVEDYWRLISYAESLKAPVTLVYRVTLPDGTDPEETSPDHRLK